MQHLPWIHADDCAARVSQAWAPTDMACCRRPLAARSNEMRFGGADALNGDILDILGATEDGWVQMLIRFSIINRDMPRGANTIVIKDISGARGACARSDAQLLQHPGINRSAAPHSAARHLARVPLLLLLLLLPD